MTKKDANKLDHGIYKLYWKDPGLNNEHPFSYAAIGIDRQGKRWYAPINWVAVPSYKWKWVRFAEFLMN
jgi:hypothetical protein